MLKKALLALALGAAWAAEPALAFSGCHGVECWDRVPEPDVYRTVERDVVVQPGFREVVSTPPVVARRVEPVVVAPARAWTERIPAVYGTAVHTEMVEPASVHYRVTPPVTRIVREHVVVRPGGYRWARTVSPDGFERRCKVPVAPVVRSVAREVVVAPPRRIAVYQPAVYRNVAVPVLVRPAMKRRVVSPAVVAYRERHVVVEPGRRMVVDHPPVVAKKRCKVLVRRGGYAWARAH